MKRAALIAGLLLTFVAAFSGNALATHQSPDITILPDPSTPIDGNPVAIPYDEFLSFAAKVLNKWDDLGLADFNGAYDSPTGTGGLDILLYTGAGGQDNQDVGANHNVTDFNFEDPVDAPGGGTSMFSGTWGAGLEPNGPVLVDDLLAYLQDQFGPQATIPVFTFDINETGANPNMMLTARVQITDPNNSDAVIAEWSLDAIANGVFDPTAFITVFGQICIDGITQDFCVNNNQGSGKMDFLIMAPTMDLSLYDGLGYEFHGFISLKDIDNGFEELFISGAFTSQPPEPVIPEPTTLLMLGSALGLTLARTRFFHKS